MLADRPLIIIPCGGKKQPEGWRGPAHDLYTGVYFRGCLRAALALTTSQRVWILSGRYGLLGLRDETEPYEQRIDEPGAIAPSTVIAQAQTADILYAPRVIGLTGAAYARHIEWCWRHAEFPLRGVGGIGKQLARLKIIAREGQL